MSSKSDEPAASGSQAASGQANVEPHDSEAHDPAAADEARLAPAHQGNPEAPADTRARKSMPARSNEAPGATSHREEADASFTVSRIEAWAAGPREARRQGRPSSRRRGLIAAAALLAVGGAYAAGHVLGRPSRADIALAMVPPKPPAPEADPSEQIAKMAGEIRTLAAGLDTMRTKLETMRANSDTMNASVEALRVSVERNRPGEDIRALKKSLDGLKSGLDQVKADSTATLGQMAQKIDHVDHDPSAKLAQISDRLDRLDRDQAAKLAQIGDRLDRIERRTAAPDITGSIPHASAAQRLPPPKPDALAQTRAAALQPPPAPKPQIIQGMLVRDVEYGTALIEGRTGLFEISTGDIIPGVGRVESIERRGSDWVVVTNRGLIEAERH